MFPTVFQQREWVIQTPSGEQKPDPTREERAAAEMANRISEPDLIKKHFNGDRQAFEIAVNKFGLRQAAVIRDPYNDWGKFHPAIYSLENFRRWRAEAFDPVARALGSSK